MSVFVYLLPITTQEPLKLPVDGALQDTFKAQVKNWKPEGAVIMRLQLGPYIVLYDMALAQTHVRHSEAWEKLVRDTEAPIPAIRGPVVVMSDQEVNWDELAEHAARHFHQELQLAEATDGLSKLTASTNGIE